MAFIFLPSLTDVSKVYEKSFKGSSWEYVSISGVENDSEKIEDIKNNIGKFFEEVGYPDGCEDHSLPCRILDMSGFLMDSDSTEIKNKIPDNCILLRQHVEN